MLGSNACMEELDVKSTCIWQLFMWQDSKKLGKFLGKWNGETETRKLNQAKKFEQLAACL